MKKLVDIDNEKFWDILFDEAYVEGQQANRIAEELESIAISEEEIRNQVINDFAARLKDSLIHNYRHLLETDTDGFEWLTTDVVGTHIDEIAEQLIKSSNSICSGNEELDLD